MIPSLDTVAGVTFASSFTSKINLTDKSSFNLSPFDIQSTFESSNVVFKFSIQSVSAGPSKNNHFFFYLFSSSIYYLIMFVSRPSFHI